MALLHALDQGGVDNPVVLAHAPGSPLSGRFRLGRQHPLLALLAVLF